MAWNKLKDGAKTGKGIGKALQLSKALGAMGFTSWNTLEPGDYNRKNFIHTKHFLSYEYMYRSMVVLFPMKKLFRTKKFILLYITSGLSY